MLTPAQEALLVGLVLGLLGGFFIAVALGGWTPALERWLG